MNTPKVTLPDYKKIVAGIERKKVEVTDEEIARLKTEKEKVEKERLRQEILAKVGEEAELEIPLVLIESEHGRMMENLKHQVGYMLNIDFSDYLKKINKNEQEIADSLRREAEKTVRNFLVLKAIQSQENISVSQDEVLKNIPDVAHIDREKLKEYTEEMIKNEKTFQLLEGLLK